MAAKTLFEKIWEEHVVHEKQHEPSLLYIDLHLVHEVTSPQAFEGLRVPGARSARRIEPSPPWITTSRPPIAASRSPTPIRSCRSRRCGATAREFGVRLFDLGSREQGIVHVIGPELGLTQPGMTIVCGDSHTATHGAFGALAFGIGTSEVEHVLATQCLWEERPQTFEIRVDGKLGVGVGAKDLILGIIGRITTNGATGHVIEYRGSAIEALSMEERMTVCNMSIEGGARAGMVAADQTTVEYLRGRRYVPSGKEFDELAARWLAMPQRRRREIRSQRDLRRRDVRAAGDVGHQSRHGHRRSRHRAESRRDCRRRTAQDRRARARLHGAASRALRIEDIKIDRVFIGSCTNSRHQRSESAAAGIVKGTQVAPSVHAMVVPGSQQVKREAESLGLDRIFTEAGFEWRESGCSMCLAMNPDILAPGERCASTSNRNFEGRQGKGGRTHLVSPAMAAAAAIAGHFVDVRDWAQD